MKQVPPPPNPDRELSREERIRYEAQEARRRVFILRQVLWLMGRADAPPGDVACPTDPRKP